MIPKQFRIVDSEIVGSKEIEPRLILRWSPAAPVGSKEQIEAEMVTGGADRGHLEQIEPRSRLRWTPAAPVGQIGAEMVTGEAR